MKYTQKSLPNGLRSITVEDKDSLSVTILILVNTGSRFEKEEEAGIAHFVEHTIFKGTEHRPDVYRIGMEVENLGAQMNAFTSYDYTGYYIKCPKENFEKAFEILSDMFLNSLFKAEDINKERGVILEEMRMYEDQPMDKVHSVFAQLLFGKHPLGRDIIGNEKTIKSVKRKMFQDFIGRFYDAKNTVISVAGGINEETVLTQIEKYFSDLRKGSENVLDAPFSKTTSTSGKYKYLEKPINQTHLILGGFAPGREEPEKKYKVRVANAILGRGFSSRLFQEIRERQGLAYYVYSSVDRFEEIENYKIAMGVENSKIQNAVDGVLKQLEVMKKGDFTDAELDRAKNYLIGSLSLDLESTNQLALWYGQQLLFEEFVLDVDDVQDLIRKVDRDTIISVCEEMFSVDNLFLASVSPHKNLKIDF